MKKKLNFIIPLVIYPFDVMVSFGETNEEIDKHFKKYNLSADDISMATITSKTVQGRTVMFSTNQTLIRLVKFTGTPKDYGNLQHEIFHAVTFVMDRIGMKLVVEESDEAYSYLIDYLTVEIYKKIK
ncbi:MAG TPA: hypothetical protein PLX17_02240 [Chitinophagaceae bacterium]|nr:hypothetical protein [Chitinophagaceae bacterium]